MKKILTLFALVLMSCMGAWAQDPRSGYTQISSHTQLEDGMEVYMKNVPDGSRYLAGITAAVNTTAWSEDNNIILHNVGNNQWKLQFKTANEAKYIKYQTGQTNASLVSDETDATVFTASTKSTNNIRFTYDNTVAGQAYTTYQLVLNNGVLTSWGGSDEAQKRNWTVYAKDNKIDVTYHITATDSQGNNQITFDYTKPTTTQELPTAPTLDYFDNIQITDAVIVDAEHTSFNVTATYNFPFMPGKYYQLSNRVKGVSYVACDKNGTAIHANTTASNDEGNHLWYFVHKPNTQCQFYIYSVNGKGITGNSTTGNSYVSMTDSPTAYTLFKKNDDGAFCFKVGDSEACLGKHQANYNGSENFTVSSESGLNKGLSTWLRGGGELATNDDGSVFWVEEFDESVFNVSNGMGEGYVGSIPNFADFASAKDAYTANKTAASLKAALTAYAALDERVALASNKFYYFRHFADNKHEYSWLTSTLSNNSGEDRMSINHDETPVKSAIFYYDGSKLIAYDGGLYANANTTSLTSYDWTLEDASNNTYYLKNGTNALTYWGYDGNANSKTNNDVWMKAPESWSQWALKEVVSLPLTISAAGYATLYAPVALTIPAGVTAYTGAINGNVLTLTPLESTIPANTAVVIKGAATTHNFAITTGGSFGGTNNLHGYIATTPVTSILTLQKHDDEVGFWNFTGENVRGFSAYLNMSDIPAGSNSLSMRFEDVVTAIENAIVAGETGAIFDLQGRRVMTPAKGQMYVKNGKKFVF